MPDLDTKLFQNVTRDQFNAWHQQRKIERNFPEEGIPSVDFKGREVPNSVVITELYAYIPHPNDSEDVIFSPVGFPIDGVALESVNELVAKGFLPRLNI